MFNHAFTEPTNYLVVEDGKDAFTDDFKIEQVLL